MIPLQQFHTFALSAKADNIIQISDVSQLLEIDWSLPFCILGEGSNTVFTEDFLGQVIQISNKGISVVESADEFIITVGAGENWHEFVKFCLNHNMFGLENLALIPGTVGAAPVQNIGAYGLEVKDVIAQVNGFNIATSQFESLSTQECQFAYRDSIFKGALKEKFVITEVVFNLTKHWRPNLSYGSLKQLFSPSAQEIFEEVSRIRSEKLPDPKCQPNAGSFFKNPIIDKTVADELLDKHQSMPNYIVDSNKAKIAAGWLIEQAGLKGYLHGGVAVSAKQALVLINHNSGTPKELLELISLIQQRVLTQFGVALEHEVRLMGCTNEIKVEAK